MYKTLAFIYDHRYYKFKDKIYSSGAFEVHTWERFLSSFDNLIVFGTLIDASKDDVKNLNIVSDKNVKFIHIEYVNSSLPNFIKNIFFHNSTILKNLNQIDAMVVRFPGSLSFNAYRIAKKNSIPIGIEVVGCPFDAYWNYGGWISRFLSFYYFFLMKKYVKYSTHVIYVTKFFLQKRYPTNGISINVSNVSIKNNKSFDDINNLKIKNNKESNKFKIGLCGSFNVRYKGHKELLLALSSNKNLVYEVQFVGSGNFDWVVDFAKKLKINSNVKILGKLKSGFEMNNWLLNLDLYVHPSKQEGLPRVVIEAMNNGLNVLASSVAGIPELLEKNFLHEPGDYLKLSKQINEILNLSEDKKNEISKNNFIKSLDYSNKILNKKRNNFWNQFKNQNIK